ncbi:sugar ABC transporter ATP-binding protein [Mesorhizobium sp. ZMM04-5]|uniref:Sugar ABC transporter ATP-binding protein n=1 Tax=Mesorhizobium marinum TaxID=3228790 RepID=A0ABV3R3U0_9HYPH
MSFGAVQALKAMQLVGHAGKVHAVMGENGAGKSTLMKLLSGVYRPDSGTIRLNGEVMSFDHPRDAQDAGISTIFQEFSLLPNLSVAENLFLGREVENGRTLSAGAMRRRTVEALAELDLRIDPDRRVGSLSVGQQQMVEIAKGVVADASVFIFDEPTAALASHEVETLFALIRRLTARGKCVFYISHRLSEVFAICDDVTIMKDGAFVLRVPTAETTVDEVIRGMVGRPIEELFESRAEALGPILLASEALVGERAPAPLSLRIHEGEIVGIAGLEGQGQQQLMRLIAGFDPVRSGTLELAGRPIGGRTARQRMAAGIGFVPESRKDDGLFLSLDIGANMTTAAIARRPLLSWVPHLGARIADVMKRLAVKAPDAKTPVVDLSGGNQQKVVLGRWLLAGARVLLCEEPTRGVDVGAKREIYRQLREFTREGRGILVTSRELPELIGLCDRLLVIRNGAIVAEMDARDATEDELLRSALPAVESEAA